ncbi:MAG: hypothetical protein JO302_03030 [Candidatus Eremiobacteraeota bacterium]|nr:hypothetical protein [Candidatus Eremiobacteraeota bacterium]
MLAIVFARLRAERRTIALCCAAAALAGSAQGRGAMAAIFACAPIGMILALLQGPGRHQHLDLCEQSAPLFGRELARAKALAACIAATAATLAYSAALAIPNVAKGLDLLPVTLAAAIASTLVALSGTIRNGSLRLLYVALACTTALTAYLIVGIAGSAAAELAFCVLVSFLALRQYGEGLARYDPAF